jgi:hypothetical protein
LGSTSVAATAATASTIRSDRGIGYLLVWGTTRAERRLELRDAPDLLSYSAETTMPLLEVGRKMTVRDSEREIATCAGRSTRGGARLVITSATDRHDGR